MQMPGSGRINSLEISLQTAQETFEFEQEKLKDGLSGLLISKIAKDAVGTQEVERALEQVVIQLRQQGKSHETVTLELTNECIEVLNTHLEDSQEFLSSLNSLKTAVSNLDLPSKAKAVDSTLTEAKALLRLQAQQLNRPKVFPVQFLGEATCTGDCCCSATVVNFKSSRFCNVFVLLEPDVGHVQHIALGNIDSGAQVITFSAEPFSDLCKNAEIRLEVVSEDNRKEFISKQQHLSVDSEPIPYCSLTKLRGSASIDPKPSSKEVSTPSISRYQIAKMWHLAKERYPTVSDTVLEQVFDSALQQQLFSWDEVANVLRKKGYVERETGLPVSMV